MNGSDNMEDYTYIVFGTSGTSFSRMIKDTNQGIRIIHFCDKYYEEFSSADIKIYLDDISYEGIISSYARYSNLEKNDEFNREINNALKNVKKAIIMDGIEDGYYPLMLHITKKLLCANIPCFNLFFEPFNFLGKKRKDYYKNFFNEITSIKSNNYYFSCDELKKYGIMEYNFESIFSLINRLQYAISLNLEKDVNATIENVIDEELKFMEDSYDFHQNNKKRYTYASVIYDDDIVATTIGEPSFYYKSDIDDLDVDDKVLIDRNGKKVVGIVIDIEDFDEDEVPFPVDKTKNIIKILEKGQLYEEEYSKSDFYIDPCDHYMLVVYDEKNAIDGKIKLVRGFVVDNNCAELNELIAKCDIIITVGNINLSKYDLSHKFIININNKNNVGEYTITSYLLDIQDVTSMIKAIDYSIFYSGFITNDLFDIETSINGEIEYKKVPIKEKKSIYQMLDTNKYKKVFFMFEMPLDISFSEVCNIVEEAKIRYNKIEFNFGAVPIGYLDETMINVFFELNGSR